MNLRDGNADQARVDALFEELLDLEAGPARESRLLEACRGDTQLEAQLRKLLELTTDPAGEALDGGIGDYWDDLLETRGETERPVALTVAGPWRLIRELGRGGMGTVYLGHRDDGEFHQEAAIKLVHAGEQDREILGRFELERQILAGLRHPNIAQLLDGGRTAEGHPYFAMEYVLGRSIKQYCDDERLTVDQRLQLFIQVGRAVEHAHRNLVVHRDLKPSNIVVTDAGAVKLLDFGIAKLLGGRPLGAEPLTGTVLRVLTPEYASPEQIQGIPITTASDTYQLGLLLYELLTGQRAHRLKSRTLGELQRAVCNEEPTRPSTLVTAPGADPSAAWSRRTQPETLSRKLHGDLDNIILLALRKEPERRYASVSQLIDDIERHLAGRPVSARAPTFGYRSAKFLRRHAWATAAGAGFLLLLLGYAATATIQSREIRQQRDRAEVEAARARRVTEFIVGIFQAADPYQNRGEELTATELLEAGAQAALSDLQDEPAVLSEMLLVLGTVSSSLGAYERAEAFLSEGLERTSALHPEGGPDVARAQILLAAVLNEGQEHDRAYDLATQALATYRRFREPVDPDIAEALSAVGLAETFRGNLEASETYLREAVAMREALGTRDADTARDLNNLGSVLLRRNDYAGAESYHRRALALRRFLFPAEHPDVSESLNNLAVALRRQQRPDEAEPLLREALEIRRRVFGPRHVRVANTLNNLGELLRTQGHLDEAEALQSEALAIRREVLGSEHSNVAFSLNNLGKIYADGGRLDLAKDRFVEALAMLRRVFPQGHHTIAYPAVSLGRLYVSQGRVAEGAALLEEALSIRRAALGDEASLTAEARLALGICRRAEGRRDDALGELRSGFAILEAPGNEGDEGLMAEARKALASLEAAPDAPAPQAAARQGAA
jgi:serine/threonine-protein kinase